MFRARILVILMILLPLVLSVPAFGADPIPKLNWSLKYVDSQELIGEYTPATAAFDGRSDTLWHTVWDGGIASLPHEIQINLNYSYDISGFRYLPRQDGVATGRIGSYEIYVSSDGTNWGSPVAKGTFANDASEKEVTFSPVTGSYIRLRALSELSGKQYVSVAEIGVLGTARPGNQPPYCAIEHPQVDLAIGVGDQLRFIGKAGDYDGNLPLSYLWNFGGAGIADAPAQTLDGMRFDRAGTYKISFKSTDSLGLACPNPPTRTITVTSTPPNLLPNWSKLTSTPFPVAPATGVKNPVLTAASVTDLAASSVMTPFIFREDNGQWWMFFGIAVAGDSRGYIGVASSPDGLNWTYGKVALTENFHISAPFVFKYDGAYYMIPESPDLLQIRLYKAVNFPYQWEYQSTLASNHNRFADPQLLWYNNSWWLFASDPTNVDLHLYYADSLTGPWTLHPACPVVSGDGTRARPAGRVMVLNQDRLLRLAQNDDVSFGQEVRVFEIDMLSRTSFREHEIPESPILKASGSGWNANGMHHIDSWWTGSQWISAVDGLKDGVWSIGIYQSVDPATPTAAITSPVSGTTVSGTVTVEATATDNLGVSKVELYVDGTLNAGITTAPYRFAWDTRTLPNGSHTLQAKAYDGNGNVGQSATVTVQVANTASGPSAAITSPIAGSIVNGTVPVTASVTGATTVASVQLFVNGTLSGTASTPPYTINWNTTAVANGPYSLTVKASDGTAIIATSTAISVTVANDVIAPTASIVAPANGGSVSGTTTVAVTATDNTAVTKVEIYVNGTLAGTDTASPYNFTWNTATLPPGAYRLSAKAYDAAGNVGTSTTFTVNVLPVVPVIPTTGWKLLYVDSQELVGENGAAANAFDGNPATIWHTQWLNGNAPLPHEIQIDLGASYSVSGFRYLPRQDGGTNGTIGQYEFYLSSDGTRWGTAVATGTFTATAAEKEVLFPATAGRFVRLRALTSTNGGPWTSMAELKVEGVAVGDPALPTAAITAPATGATVGGVVPVAATASSGSAITKVELYVRGTLAGTSTASPYTFSWNTAAIASGSCELFVRAYDAAGKTGDSPKVTVTVQNGAPLIPQTGWKLLFADSQELAGENGAATNAFDGNKSTLWHTKWLGGSTPLPHEIQIDLGGMYAVSGFRYLPRQDGGTNGTIARYEFYVSSDGAAWGTAAAAGTFAASTAEKEVIFPAVTGRYIRLRALSEINGQPWTAVAELNVEGTAAGQSLAATITSPAAGAIVGGSATITATAGGSATVTKVELYVNGTLTATDTAAPFAFTWDTATLPNGACSLTVKAYDSTGATATSAPVAVTVSNGVTAIPQAGWKLLYVDSQELYGENGAATNAFDGSKGTMWHTRWQGGSPPPPHEIQIDLGQSYTVNGFRYLPRQDGGINGTIGRYEFYVSSDGVTWGTAAATGTFPATTAEKEVLFAGRTGRYVRLRALAEVNGNPWTSAAELNVLGGR